MMDRPSRLRGASFSLLILGVMLLPVAANAQEAKQQMTTLYICMLLQGEKWTAEQTPEVEQLHRAHLAHLERLVNNGRALIVGPFGDGDNTQIRGLLVLQADSLEAATTMAEADPAVRAGRFSVETLKWYTVKDVFRSVKQFDDSTHVPRELAKYYFGFLVRGPKWTPDRTPEVMKIQEGHMANINKMAELGKLVAAGPLMDGGPRRGILVFKTDTREEAEELTSHDPAVKAGRLLLELNEWWVAKGVLP